MNTELLLKVKEQILKEPRQFQMVDWFTTTLGRDASVKDSFDKKEKAVKIPNCGTAACIAGWGGAILRGRKPSEKPLWANNNDFDLSYDAWEKLIRFYNWPTQFRKYKSEGTKNFAKQAAARIDHFIATEGRE